jgi:hypothetical protein
VTVSDTGLASPGHDYNRRAVARSATTLLVLGVLAGSAAAFAVSEGLKVQRAAVTGTQVAKTFSPVCDCATDRASIAFRLTRPDRLDIWIVNSNGRIVRTLVGGKLFGRGAHHFTWNGRNEAGKIVPEGNFKPRIKLERAGRTLTLPNPIKLDVMLPRILAVKADPILISPDGDGRADVVRVRYRLSEHAHAVLLVNGKQRVRSRFQRLRDEVDWFGKVGGRALSPGRYRLDLVAVDLAGNRSRARSAGVVRIRYVALGEGIVRTAPGRRIVVSVSTDARRVRWALRRGTSVVASGSSGHRLILRAPAAPGRYVLVATAVRHQARATVVVRRR